jgi:hypothetical protein
MRVAEEEEEENTSPAVFVSASSRLYVSGKAYVWYSLPLYARTEKKYWMTEEVDVECAKEDRLERHLGEYSIYGRPRSQEPQIIGETLDADHRDMSTSLPHLHTPDTHSILLSRP